MNTGERSPEACDCGSCPNHEANLRVYRMLNPIRSRFLRSVTPDMNRVVEPTLHHMETSGRATSGTMEESGLAERD